MAHAARKRALPWLLTTASLVLGIGAAQEFTGHAQQASLSLQTPASGSCQIVSWPAAVETHYAAMNYLQWGGSHYCGQCIEVWCADSSKEIVHVVDWCRDCKHSDLRLSSSVFQALAPGGSRQNHDRYEVQWRFVRCPEASDLGFQVCLKSGGSSHSLAIQPVNSAEPIHSIAINGMEAAREFPGLFYSVKDAHDFDLKRIRLTITTQSGVTIENTISLESGECVRVDSADSNGRRSSAQSVSSRRPRIRRADGSAAMERSRNLKRMSDGSSSSVTIDTSTITTTTTTSSQSSQNDGSSAAAGSTEGSNVSCSEVTRSSGSSSGLDGFILCQPTSNGSSSSATNDTTSADSTSASTSGSTSLSPTTVSSESGSTTAPTTVASGSGSASTVASPSTATPTTASGSASASTLTPTTSGSTSTVSTSTTGTVTETTTTASGLQDITSQTATSPYQSPQIQSGQLTTAASSETSLSTTSLSSASSSTPSPTESTSALTTTDVVTSSTGESFSLPPIIATNQAPAFTSTSSPAASGNSAPEATSSSSSSTLSPSGSSSIEQSSSDSGSLSSSMDNTDGSSSQSQAHPSTDGSTRSNGTAAGSASNATNPNGTAQTSMGDIFTSPLFFAALLLGIVGCAGSCAAYRAKKKSLLSATPRHPVVFTPTDIESSMEVHAPDPPYGTRTSRSSSTVRAMSNDLLAGDVMIFQSATL